jgi:hypothetical protein
VLCKKPLLEPVYNSELIDKRVIVNLARQEGQYTVKRGGDRTSTVEKNPYESRNVKM